MDGSLAVQRTGRKWRAGSPTEPDVHEVVSGDEGAEGGFPTLERVVSLGPVRMVTLDIPPAVMRLVESEPELHCGTEGHYQLVIPLRGTVHTAWCGVVSTFGPGDVVVHGRSQPCEYAFQAPESGGSVVVAALLVPRHHISLPTGRVERALGRRLPGDRGIGALLAGFVGRLAHEVSSGACAYRASDGPHLGAALLDLAHAAFAHLTDADGAGAVLEPESRRRTLLLRIQDHVRRQLHDPHLTPRTVAAAHHISVSYLHRLFQEYGEGTTVAAWIRHQRLERTRRDLADPLLAATPVYEIAARWGFSQAAPFTRAFRAAYGMPPRDYRHGALCA